MFTPETLPIPGTLEDSLPETTKRATTAYLLARAFAETLRAEIDKIERDILDKELYTIAPKWRERKHPRPEIITEPKHTYLMTTHDFEDYWHQVDKRTRAAKIKPDDMNKEFCPALVAENIQRLAENTFIDAVLEMLNQPPEFAERLRSHPKLQKEFIDINLRFIIGHQDYIAPVL